MKLYWGMFCLFFTVIVLLSLVLADEELLKIDKTSQPSDYYDPKLREMWQVDSPTGQPTGQPTGEPSGQPSGEPTTRPTSKPSARPSGQPSGQPTGQPSAAPTSVPTNTLKPTSIPTTGTPSQVPSSYPTRYGSAALDGIAGNQTYYCHSEHFLTAIENAWQTVYLDVKMEHFLLQHINITISPYEEGIDYLRLLQADHDKYIFTSTYLAGNLNIRHYGGGTFWYTDFLPIANQIQYLFKRDVMHPEKCLDYHTSNYQKTIALTFTDSEGVVSNELVTMMSIRTAGLLFTEGNLQAITNANSYVAYEVENPALQESSLINITYTTDGY